MANIGDILMPHRPSLASAVGGTAQNFRRQLSSPAATQRQILRNIIEQNHSSAFGVAHQFSKIENYLDYAKNVPIFSYEALMPWMQRVEQGEPAVLSSAAIIAFEETGGSSFGRKLIPYTAQGLEAFQRGLLPWLDDLHEQHPSLAVGSFYWSISPACRQPKQTSGGMPVGLPTDAAYLGQVVGEAFSRQLAVPSEVGAITDFAAWRDSTLLHLLAAEDLSLISVWSPTFLTQLLKEIPANFEQLLGQVLLGQLLAQHPKVELRFTDNRLQTIRAALGQAKPDYSAIWPQLRVISCWDHASAASVASSLRTMFPNVCVQGKGLLATEGLVSIPLTEFAYPVLAIESGFFEFIDSEGRIFLADQVKAEHEYQLLMTTHSGLYRYAIGDMLRVKGFAMETPMLEFIGRSNTGSDLVGEKLNDAFVMKTLLPLVQGFAMLVPSSDHLSPAYVLLLDGAKLSSEQARSMAVRIDAALRENPQYAYARNIGQLHPLTALLCEHPLESWLKYRTEEKGQRLGDIKLPALLNDTSWTSWVCVSPKIA